ncbi:MAG: tRNA (adenosine(37)-N6)-threonylcarbamoyltransferase complex dimerization subunit type 1 TsaB [Treponema sp.]|jgi:tRNA threonylcarbamoyladenosine biosynthesis protein TsaB|nr:tRNA (adenosine(37)-N6)-threonylcarbamoyltransferase complex dimerization subunit type 1 TsaB [Treponema sp.]
MNILALDTAVSVLSTALASGPEREIRYAEFDTGLNPRGLRHSELLMDMADALLKSAGIGPAGLDMTACMRGPGSFTGLRIGFAAAKGIAGALGIPLVSVPSLDCMAAPFGAWPGLVIPAIDARKGRFFTAIYREGRQMTPPMDAEPAAIAAAIAAAASPAPLLLTGPDAPALMDALKAAGEFPPGLELCLDPHHREGNAKNLLLLSEQLYILGKLDALDSGPEYLRKSDAELS